MHGYASFAGAAKTGAVLVLALGVVTPPVAGEEHKVETRTGVRVGLVWDARYKEHQTGHGHPESPTRLDWIWEGLDAGGLLPILVRIQPRACEVQDLLAVHSQAYLDSVRRAVAEGLEDLPTGDTAICARTHDIALLAAGGLLAACDAVMAGTVTRAFCAVRPPGHHATRERGMGFCVFNNVAVAARYLQKQHGLERILILDWDVHHGNGTYDIFAEDPTVMHVDLHQRGIYPGTGSEAEAGTGPGRGSKVNFPLARGSGDQQFRELLTAKVRPLVDRFRPQFILVSAGFDAHQSDPLGELGLTNEGYAELTRIVCGFADQHSQGRLVSVLEGGYSREALTNAVAAHVRAMLGPPVQP